MQATLLYEVMNTKHSYTHAKYLGVVIDRNLNWNQHVKMITNC